MSTLVLFIYKLFPDVYISYNYKVTQFFESWAVECKEFWCIEREVKLDAAAIGKWEEEERGWGGVSATDVVVGAVGAFYAEATAFVE